MKKGNKLHLFVIALIFLSVFFACTDKVNKATKAAMDCYDLCADEGDNMQKCFDDCEIGNNGVTSWDDSGNSTGGGTGSCYNDFYTPECCAENQGYWYNNVCNTDPDISAYAYNQAQCDSIYGPGYTPNADRTGCIPIQTTGGNVNSDSSDPAVFKKCQDWCQPAIAGNFGDEAYSNCVSNCQKNYLGWEENGVITKDFKSMASSYCVSNLTQGPGCCKAITDSIGNHVYTLKGDRCAETKYNSYAECTNAGNNADSCVQFQGASLTATSADPAVACNGKNNGDDCAYFFPENTGSPKSGGTCRMNPNNQKLECNGLGSGWGGKGSSCSTASQCTSQFMCNITKGECYIPCEVDIQGPGDSCSVNSFGNSNCCAGLQCINGSCEEDSNYLSFVKNVGISCSACVSKVGPLIGLSDSGSASSVTNNSGSSESCDARPSCWFWNCCSSANTSSAGGNSTSAPIAITTAPIITKSGTYPADSQIMLNGSLQNSQGQMVAPPGTIQIQMPTSGLGSNFVMCANGILAPECRDANGNSISGAPVVLGSNITNGGGLGNIAGVGGGTTSKCEVGFEPVGEVCFPTKATTGLSNAPIYVIISNIFSWLMGLFTTLAVLAFVVSGVQYFMASGNEDLAETAKGNAVNAIIGIIIGLSGFIIIKAIAAALSGQSMFF